MEKTVCKSIFMLQSTWYISWNTIWLFDVVILKLLKTVYVLTDYHFNTTSIKLTSWTTESDLIGLAICNKRISINGWHRIVNGQRFVCSLIVIRDKQGTFGENKDVLKGFRLALCTL